MNTHYVFPITDLSTLVCVPVFTDMTDLQRVAEKAVTDVSALRQPQTAPNHCWDLVINTALPVRARETERYTCRNS